MGTTKRKHHINPYKFEGAFIGTQREGSVDHGRILSVLTKAGAGYYLYRLGDGSREFIQDQARISQLRLDHVHPA